MSWMRRALVLALLACCPLPGLRAQKEYGFDNTRPSGQPYLKPEESLRRMKVADGFEVKLFAAEPMVINPIAMTVDEKGRVWVIESFEYPRRTPKGRMPRDRIVILEDTDGDGVADKRTVFAEGKDFPVPFDMASGLEVGHGGVFVGAPPYLFFIENQNDRPGKVEVLLKGFGAQDTHETLNTFQWGPDGRLYGLQGVFTQSEVAAPQQGADAPRSPVKLNAGVWRYDVRAKKFETFAEGTSNPWGMDYRNSDGQFLLCCCVIPHLFHMSPGGIYKRQAGQSYNPYAYSYLNEICDHTFHKESGWAHAGLIALDTPLMPPEYRDSVIFGSIHGCSIKRNVLRRNGSTYVASRANDFLVSGDKNFRPINLRWGPNGEIYCTDWHDQNPCHQAKPDSWDYEHGRVFRLQRKGLETRKAEDLGARTVAELIPLLGDPNPWRARTAARLLAERRRGLTDRDVNNLRGEVTCSLLPALWALYSTGHLDEKRAAGFLDQFQAEGRNAPALRGWTVRLLGESGGVSGAMLERLTGLAAKERSAAVRLELAGAALRLGKSSATSPLLRALMGHKEDAKDPVIPQILWLAYEEKLTSGAKAELGWLKDHAAGNALVTDTIVPRAMRRLVATGKKEDLQACVAFLRDLKDSGARRQALAGLVEALQNQQLDAPLEWRAVQAELLKDGDAEVQRLARRLAVHFQDVEAARRALAVARDVRKALRERVEAVHDLAVVHPLGMHRPLLELLERDPVLEVRLEAARALAAYEAPQVLPEIARVLLGHYKQYPPEVRVEVVNLLAGRKEWARELLTAVGQKQVPPTDLNNNLILRLQGYHDKALNAQVEAVWGKVRDTPAELNALIDKMRLQIDQGRPSFGRGAQVFETTCAKCHKFEGKGHEVGPPLDGAGRDIEYLLVNVIDPNRVVGAPYFTRLVTLKNGRVESGLLAAEDDQAVTLKGENDALKVIPRKDIDEIEVQPKSVMPEGLVGALKPGEFRDLVRYVMADPFLTEVFLYGPLNPSDRFAKDVKGLVRDAGVSRGRPPVGVHGRIALPAAKGGGEAVAVVEADVTAPAATRTRLLLGAGARVQAWVNGTLVFDGKAGDGPARPDQAGADVELRPGSNRLVFKVTYRGDKLALFARLHDPDRKLRYPEPKE
jgi:putative membrane-bound dehydrogenase-like protein